MQFFVGLKIVMLCLLRLLYASSSATFYTSFINNEGSTVFYLFSKSFII